MNSTIEVSEEDLSYFREKAKGLDGFIFLYNKPVGESIGMEVGSFYCHVFWFECKEICRKGDLILYQKEAFSLKIPFTPKRKGYVIPSLLCVREGL